MMVLLSLVSMVTAVMGVCPIDRDTDHRLRTNCSSTGVTHIPMGLEPTTEVLILSRNLFSSLSWSSFTHFPDIYEVDLTSNQIPEVTPSSAPSLPTLSVLRLSSNLLTSLPDSAFSACPALTELRLQKNNIFSLSNHCFNGLRFLRILDLTSNRIAVLPDLLLHPLIALESLYLENNQIQVVPSDWFFNEYVAYLFLSANPWACSCRLGYLSRYLREYEDNVHVTAPDGATISRNPQSVVCYSPPSLKGRHVMDLQEPDLCPPPAPDSVSSLSPALSNTPTETAPHQTSATHWTIPAPPPPWTTADISPLAPPTGTAPPPRTTTDISAQAPPTGTATHPLTTTDISAQAPPTGTAPHPLTTTYISAQAPPTGTAPHPLTTTDISAQAPPTGTAPPPLTTADASTLAPPTGTTSPLPLYRCATLRPLPLPPPWRCGLPPTRRAPRADVGVGAASFCLWMLIGSLTLCVAALVAILVSSVRLVQMMRMLKVIKAGGYPPLAPPPPTLYRSVLFVQHEGAEPESRSLTQKVGP